jgi:acyl-CoA synthetase (AMP-forming)/AMP-acid ligase II
MAEFTFAPLFPVQFLDRAARSFPERLAVVDGDIRLTYAELAARSDRLVTALARAGVSRGDRVAALCANSHVMLELHQAVPARGVALVALNVRLWARQGIGNVVARPLRVLDPAGEDVPADGETLGETAVSGNDVMLGYYRDERATAAVTRSGCFLTGDLGVMHPDGYVEIRDRAKDVNISGGENIASVELERAIDAHPDVVESDRSV